MRRKDEIKVLENNMIQLPHQLMSQLMLKVGDSVLVEWNPENLRSKCFSIKEDNEEELFNEGFYCIPDRVFEKCGIPIESVQEDDYMANSDEIRTTASHILESWKEYFYLDELKNAKFYLDKYQLVETGIQPAVNRINVLEIAINDDDLVTMRRLSNYGNQQFEDMKNAFEKLSKINMEEEKQIFFAEILQ